MSVTHLLALNSHLCPCTVPLARPPLKIVPKKSANFESDLMKMKDGWIHVRTRGSHHQFKHPSKPGLVTIPGRQGDDIAIGTLNSILKQAGLK